MAMTVKSGRWSDPTVWTGGAVPGAGAMAHIKTGHEIIYDMESDVILADVMSEMGSKLTWNPDPAKETRMRVNTAMLHGIVEMTDKALSATPGKPKHELVFHPIAGKDPGAGMGLGAVFMGPTRIRGYRKKGRLRAHDLSIPAGANTLYLAGVGGSGWQVGDELVILGTEYVLPVKTDPQYSGPTEYWRNDQKNTLDEYQFGQDEQRTITAISGDTITLNAPLDFAHTGMTGTLKDGKVITVRPVISNVSRSIRFRTATAEEDGQLDPYADITVLQKRAHLMFMRQPDVDLRYFETKNMGRTSTDPSLFIPDDSGPILASQGGPLLGDPNNVRGRYAIHLHWCGGPYLTAPLVPLIGATAWAPIGGVPIPGWAITQHSTRAAIEDCVISNGRGAGMVSELGNEIGQWVNNVVTGIRGDGEKNRWGSRSEEVTNHNGSAGIAYENQSRAILMHGNIAGSSKYAQLWHAQKTNKQMRGLRDIDLRFKDGLAKGAANTFQFWLDEVYGAISVQIPPMLDNEAWACRFGFSVIHRNNNLSPTVQGSDKTPMLMERFHCVNVPFPWEVPEYSNTYYVKDCLFQGPLNMMGVSKAVVLGNVTWDWNFANCHFRNFMRGFSSEGAGINYEGNFIDITFENVTEQTSIASYSTITNITQHAIKNVMGDWTDHPTDPNKAIIRQWRVLDSATELPTPYPLEPYGRKLPAGHPPVNPGDTPYFVLGDGTNGAASTVPTAISLTLTAGQGRGQGRVYGIIRDSVGDRRWPDWQSSESFPSNVSVKDYRTLGKLTPEQLVQRWGCWNDAGTWKCRAWFMGADRFTHVRFSFHVDFTLLDFASDFLALHDLGGPSAAPEWPDKLEAVAAPRPLEARPADLRFLSRTRLEVVDGRALSHRLRPNEVLTKLSVAGGADAALFKIENQRLVWAGAQPAVRPAPYEVVIRVTDCWGSTHDRLHQVIVMSATRVSDMIADDFNRPNTDLYVGRDYNILAGDASDFEIGTNILRHLGRNTASVIDFGSLGTSEMEVSFRFSSNSTGSYLTFRMVDAVNWLGVCIHGDGTHHAVVMCVNDVITELAYYKSSRNSMVIRCQDDRLVFHAAPGPTKEPVGYYPVYSANRPSAGKIHDLDPMSGATMLKLPANAPRGTLVGSRGLPRSYAQSYLDEFLAKALES